VGTDSLVLFDSNYYSVDPCAIGQGVELVVDLGKVTVSCNGKVVAQHERLWARGQTVWDPRHRAAYGW
jgi:hypothetical protein